MEVVDRYGYPAYCCAADGRALQPVPDTDGVQECPTCGHRTDGPGTGKLADGFDVIHRQWGLRGDLHVWRTLRARLAETPTPPDRDAVRAAYVEAFNNVTGLDVDTAAEDIVYRKEFDHGGLSGGGISLEWWRTKGLPLLVARACREP